MAERQRGVVRLATMRRVIGATTSTTGKAVAQLTAQLPIQTATNASLKPIARKVDRPETMNDIMPDKRNPNR